MSPDPIVPRSEPTQRYWGPESDQLNYSAQPLQSEYTPAGATEPGGHRKKPNGASRLPLFASMAALVLVFSGISGYLGYQQAIKEYEPLFQNARVENQVAQASLVEMSEVQGALEGDLEVVEADLSELEEQMAGDVAADAELPNLKKLADIYLSDNSNYSGTADYLMLTITDSSVTTDSLGLIVYLDQLGFTPAVIERMSLTRALDGTQTAEGKNCNASWTYHPDDGLQVVFEAGANG